MLVFFNTCGISRRERVDVYKDNIRALLNQEGDGFRIILSSCLNSRQALYSISEEFGNTISYSIINSFVPVNISFNKSVMNAIKIFGPAEAYLYIDSGISVEKDPLAFKKMLELHTSGPYGMTAGRTDTDSGMVFWLLGGDMCDESRQEEIFQNGNYVIPVGKSLNLHFQIFDHSLFENFDNRLLPDIFASHATESIFSFLNAAIKKKFIIHKDVRVRHFTAMDGGSSGFRPEYTGQPGWKHTLPIAPRTIEQIIADPRAKEVGCGYEEAQNILMHDPKLYDENGYSLKPEELRKFLMNFYLPIERFNYGLIETVFIP